jgi:hypothetical protein
VIQSPIYQPRYPGESPYTWGPSRPIPQSAFTSQNPQPSYVYYPSSTTYTLDSPPTYSYYPGKATYTSDLNVYNPLFSRKTDTGFEEESYRKEEKRPEVSYRSESTMSSSTSRFQDVINEVKSLKIELFGNETESMDFYKRNRNAYDPVILQRQQKIAKILELEELLEFYNSNKNKEAIQTLPNNNFNKEELKSDYLIKSEIQELKKETPKKIENALSEENKKENKINDKTPKNNNKIINPTEKLNNLEKTPNVAVSKDVKTDLKPETEPNLQKIEEKPTQILKK